MKAENVEYQALVMLQERAYRRCPHGWCNPVFDCLICWWTNRRLDEMRQARGYSTV